MKFDNDLIESYKAYRYVKSVNEKLLNDNRFFTDDAFLKELDAIFSKQELYVEKGVEFVRARRILPSEIDNTKKGTAFEGFDEENSFVNKSTSWPSSGRMNPIGISVLYASSDVRTAITELHPYCSEVYSVASITVLETLRIVDLSVVDITKKDKKYYFINQLQNLLSSGSDDKDYIFPQFISSFCKYRGYDGIAYKSKYARESDLKNQRGINYSIFNYDKCKAINSKLYSIKRVTVQIDEL